MCKAFGYTRWIHMYIIREVIHTYIIIREVTILFLLFKVCSYNIPYIQIIKNIIQKNYLVFKFRICSDWYLIFCFTFSFYYMDIMKRWLMVYNTTFNNISGISRWSVLLVEGTVENHWPVARHWQTVSHNVVSSTPHLSRTRTHNFSDNRH